tara:strand:- start:176 stop:397 length:222 start_codon:yes stop_codon:yes gene_type:complete
MIKSKNEMPDRGIEIDLTGPDGNAFALMGYASRLAKQLGLDSAAIINDMKSNDYDHLLEVFEEHFGEFVTLYR